MPRPFVVASLLALAPACRGDGVAPEGGGSGPGDTSTSTGSTEGEGTSESSVGRASEGSVGGSSGGSGGGSSVDSTGGMSDDSTGGGGELHGFVQLELLRAEGETENPFTGTEQVVVTLDYLECLITFYDEHPEWGFSGPDGFDVFDEWRDRLCDGSLGVPSPADCTVLEVTQSFDVSFHLSIVFEVSGDLEGTRLAFGPLPTAVLAQCEGGGAPIVRVGGNAAVRGQTAAGEQVWAMASFSPDQAATDQALPITIRAVVP